MDEFWHADESLHRSPRRPFAGRAILTLLFLTLGATAIYRLDLIGRAAYAVQRGRLDANREYLASISPQDVAGLEQLSHAYQRIAEVIKPSVVSVQSRRAAVLPDDPAHNELRKRLEELGGKLEIPVPSTNVGSGVIFSRDGYIVTSNHVVADADEIRIELADGRECDATVVGTDRMTDMAVLKIDADRLEPAQFGDSDKIKVGHIVLAVGSPFRLPQTVSHGIVSAKGRKEVALNIDYQDFIQTDAPINPGNSGGPLVNTRGEVIGINTAIATESGAFSGIGFATPSNKVVAIAEVLKAGKRVVRGFLGVEFRSVVAEDVDLLGLSAPRGVVVTGVVGGGPADMAGLRRNDVILRIDDQPVNGRSELPDLIASSPPGSKRTFAVWRDGKELTIRVELGQQPPDFSTRMSIRRLERMERNRNAPPDEPQTPESGEEKDSETAPPDDDEPMWFVEPLGIEARTLTPALMRAFGLDEYELEGGVVVTRVERDSRGGKAGMKVGDVILMVDGERLFDVTDLRTVLTDDALKRGVSARVLTPDGGRTVRLKVGQE